ncbi:unnamed protein product [Symbiodinium natans]|uniref:Uncharacterized protein n=1 Tax=Symbiodinium natans TaxID=878477 RepID=A0A812NTU0_9DINO|nr:unnamed protein product [Symbiodinium natans]
MRFPELLRDPGVPSLRHSKLPVCPKNQTGGVSSQISLPGVRRPSPTAPYILILAGAARVVDKATNLVKAVAASYLGMEPVEELLMFGQMPSVLFCRAVLQLPTWQAAWDTSTQVLDLLLVGHSHGGLMAHDVAQRLESTGFAVRGVMALDTLHVPRWTGDAEMEPKALLKNRAPDHWQLLSLEVNMMAMRTAVLPVKRNFMDKAEAFACGAVFLPKHLNDTDHFGIEADCAWDLADVTKTFTEDKEAAARPRFMNLSSDEDRLYTLEA